jgi:hypothetical protein
MPKGEEGGLAVVEARAATVALSCETLAAATCLVLHNLALHLINALRAK